ncbi:hypothetical protein R1flu_018570 [Riccia fluitans]|uniref:C3H1-type domain-containing protein n=1 Tax=Riccia fluitans TaxID=41844 RepID=A0ABD1ZGE7_9MARC
MFGQPLDHTNGGPPRYARYQVPRPPVGMTAGAPYQLPYAGGRGGGGGRGSYQPPPFPGPGSWGGYHPPNHGLSLPDTAYPPPPPGNPPREAPPSLPTSDGSFRSEPNCEPPPPPPAPKDAEVLKNLELLACFVVKNGPRFEDMARYKQADNPKFAFLFGGQRGTEAAIGHDYYEWKKVQLAWEERLKTVSTEQSGVSTETGVPDLRREGDVSATQLSHEVPGSPAGSDMEMEDDFAITPPMSEPAAEAVRVVSSPKRDRKSGFSSPVESPSRNSDRKVGATSPRVGRRSRFSSPPSDRKSVSGPVAAERSIQANSSYSASDAKGGSASSLRVGEERSQPSSGRWTSAQTASSHSQHDGPERDKGSHGPDTSKAEKEGAAPELYRRKDSRRRTGFDRPRMEDVSPPASPSNAGESKEKQREPAASVELERKDVPSRGLPDIPTRPSRWGRPEPGLTFQGDRDLVSDKGSGTRETSSLSKEHKRLESAYYGGEESLNRGRSQSPKVSGKPERADDDNSAKHTEIPKSGSAPGSLPVDEFGRLLRQGGSDSEEEGHSGEGRKRRRALSRSQSRSPGDSRRKRWSPSRSPRRRVRRSRSWSSSPRRQRSRSRTPQREGRWGGDGRGERSFPGERGGRKGGRVACFDFAKGRCQRGSSCRYLHEEANGLADDQGGRWSGGRGRGRPQGRSGRDSGEDADRHWGGKSGEQLKPRRSWHSDERVEDDAREKKLTDGLKKQDIESSITEGWEERKVDTAAAVSTSAAIPEQGSKTNSSLHLEKTSGSHETSAERKSSPEFEAVSPSLPPSQGNHLPQQTSSLPNSASSPQEHNYPASIALQYSSSLNGHRPQHVSFPPSPSCQLQQPTYSLSHSKPQQNVFPPSKQHGFSPNVSTSSLGFPTSRTQQPIFSPTPVSYSGNPSVDTQQRPPLASLPVLRPQPSYSTPQQQNFTPLTSAAMSMPVSVSAPLSTGPGGFMPRSHGTNTPAPVLQAPVGPNLTTPLSYAWMSPGLRPSVSYGLTPEQPLPQPSPTKPQAQSASSQVPPQLSIPQPVPYQFASSLPLTYGVSYSTQVTAPAPASSNDQYDPLSDSFEPGPPGAGDKKGAASYSHNLQPEDGSRQNPSEHWKTLSAGGTTPIMTNAGEVVLENVSPGLPGHTDTMRTNTVSLENVSPMQPMHMILENVSPTNVSSSFNVNTASMNYGATRPAMVMESVSPAQDRGPAVDGEKDLAVAPEDQKKKDKDNRILNLIRKAVAEHVKDLLKPTWKEGQMSKDAFKTIAKKAVDKVIGALEAKGSIPKSQEKLDLFMETSKPKIAKLVKGYVDKYVKA